MNTERVMKVIAEELGIEFGEEFDIVGSNTNPFTMEPTGLYDCTQRKRAMTMGLLVTTDNEIRKLPWTPKPRRVYFTIEVGARFGVGETVNTGTEIDKRRIERGFAFRTREEAVAKAKEMGVIEEDN